jgi:hypothetical protein
VIEAAAPLAPIMLLVGGGIMQASCAEMIRRRAKSDEIGPALQAVYDEAVAEPVPAEMTALLQSLGQKNGLQASTGGVTGGRPHPKNGRAAGGFR